jgi:hypothetical protein
VWKAIWVLSAVALLFSGTLLPSKAYSEESGNIKSVREKLREKHYYYKAFNRRDPFRSLVAGEFEEAQFDLVDINAVRLVGVLSGGLEKFAMLEDSNGFAYILKAGDPIRNGSIVSVGERTLVARVVAFGQVNSVTLRLEGNKSKGEL